VDQLQLVLTLQLHDFDVLLNSCFGSIYSKEIILHRAVVDFKCFDVETFVKAMFAGEISLPLLNCRLVLHIWYSLHNKIAFHSN